MRSPCLCLCRPLGTDTLLAKRRRATYGGGAPPFPRTSSRNASAGRSSPNGRPPSFTAALAQIGRHPSERPHATPPGSPRSWPGCPAAPIRSSSRAPPTPASVDARQRRWSATQPAHDGSALNSAESDDLGMAAAGRCLETACRGFGRAVRTAQCPSSTRRGCQGRHKGLRIRELHPSCQGPLRSALGQS